MFEIDTNALPFVRTQKALLVLDIQNEFLSPSAQIPVQQPPNFVDNILRVLPDFRKVGKVIWVRSVFGGSRTVNSEEEGEEKVVTETEDVPKQNGKDAIKGPKGESPRSENAHKDSYETVQKRIPEPGESSDTGEDVKSSLEETFLTIANGSQPRFVLPKSDGAELFEDALKAQDLKQDIEIIKTHYSAFKDGRLLQMLRAKFVTEIYICGTLTNISVYATATEAAQFGYAITLLEDCLGYRSKDRHDETLRRLEVSTGCDTVTSAELLEDIGQKEQPIQKKKSAPPLPTPHSRAVKQDETKSNGSGLDSMMAKLNIRSKNEAFTKSEDLPGGATTTHVASGEDDGSSDVTQNEILESLLLKRPPRRTAELPEKSNRVPTTVKVRRRTKKPSPVSQPVTTDSLPSSTESLPTTKDTMSTISSSESSKAQKVVAKSSVTSSNPPANHPTVKDVEAPVKSFVTTATTCTEVSEVNTPSNESPAICEGDTTIIKNLLQGDLADGIFEKIRDEVRWQKMSHQGGEVPRLVAVQGTIHPDGSIPIYRHPADESPPLLAFSPAVTLIREQAEKQLGHPLNHVLIQFYRSGTDYISEHSDKTLDIVPNTYIVNVSLGAQRTMIFRGKKREVDRSSTKSSDTSLPAPPRQAVRAPMPHNSMCKVGLVTNMRWLHGIRQDKRLQSEKSAAELAYDGARISLTFRQIGTFLSSDEQKIWGQGATSKNKAEANFVINGDATESERMVRAFGQENHSSEFDWAAHYGEGFDVLHLHNTPKLFISGDHIADVRVKLALSHFAIKWEEGKLSPSFKWKDGSLKPNAPEIPQILPVKFVDNDLSKSTVTGDIAVLLYLNSIYGPQLRPQAETAKLFSTLQLVQNLERQYRAETFDLQRSKSELELLQSVIGADEFITGKDPSIVDWMLLPLLDRITGSEVGDFGEDLEGLKSYFSRVRAIEKVIDVIGPRTASKKTVEDVKDPLPGKEGLDSQHEPKETAAEIVFDDDEDDSGEDA